MNKILKVGTRNNIQIPGKRYNLSSLISESYQTLYECKLDSKIYRLVESHIQSIQNSPSDISRHSKNLEVLKGLVALGDKAKINESDVPQLDTLEDEDVINEDDNMEELESEDVINESEEEEDDINEDDNMEELEDEDVINEDDNMEELESEDVINENEEDVPLDDIPLEEEEESDEITPEELVELKKHLKEIRRARKVRESEDEVKDEEETPEDVLPESRTWVSEKSLMTRALKKFRESSNKKAFYKSFKKLHESMRSKKSLTLAESILLYKASNSAMTHLTVELEHNPEFIYTFRECTSILSRDNAKLLECIKKQVSPGKSLVESYDYFARILLESDEIEDELVEEEEEVVLPEEDIDEVGPLAGAAAAAGIGMISKVKDVNVGKNGVSVSFNESEEEDPAEELEEEEEAEEIPAPEELEEEEDPTEEIVPEEEALESEEVTPENPAPEMPPEEELEEEDDVDDIDSEITDEEAEALRDKLMEIRKSRKK